MAGSGDVGGVRQDALHIGADILDHAAGPLHLLIEHILILPDLVQLPDDHIQLIDDEILPQLRFVEVVGPVRPGQLRAASGGEILVYRSHGDHAAVLREDDVQVIIPGKKGLGLLKVGIYLPNRFFGSGHGSLILRHSRLIACFLRGTGFLVARHGLLIPLRRRGALLRVFFLRGVCYFVIMFVYPHSLLIIIHFSLIGFLDFLGRL